ncbi:MAG: TonB-dependent receptor, partial [Epsilonproteobacteria bacterium]|nr:TonB-dependent receptor [Campylobacterota bacterium]
ARSRYDKKMKGNFLKTLSLQLNVYNVLNEQYEFLYQAKETKSYYGFTAPRTYALSLSGTF